MVMAGLNAKGKEQMKGQRAAARWGSVVSALVFVAIAFSGAAGGGSTADVTLQVTSRGNGTVTASPAGANPQPCFANQGEDFCPWVYPQGTTVRLTATATSGTFVGWSSQDCPGTGECSIELDEAESSVVAFFSPLKVGVKLAYGSDPSTPPGVEVTGPNNQQFPVTCDYIEGECFAEVPTHTPVTLTAVPNGHTFTGWNPGCEPVNQQSCMITVSDNPTWAGLRFDGAEPPPLPTTISVQFRLRKGGNGTGRVTASNIDCGTVCSAKFAFGSTITVTARPEGDSTFEGWNGVCAHTQTSCRFAVGPITSIRALFARDTTAPSAPGALSARAATRTSITIGWTASTDNIRVTGYRVYLNDAEAGTTSETQYTFERLACGRTYRLAVDASDAVGNRSPRTGMTAGTRQCIFTSRLVRVDVRRLAGTRVVNVRLRVSRATKARLRLARQGRAWAQRRYSVRAGTNLLRLPVPRRAKRGRYQLTITVTNPDGGTRIYRRGLRLRGPR
jgi:hypothetical protein